jgi:hypothetical protein
MGLYKRQAQSRAKKSRRRKVVSCSCRFDGVEKGSAGEAFLPGSFRSDSVPTVWKAVDLLHGICSSYFSKWKAGGRM